MPQGAPQPAAPQPVNDLTGTSVGRFVIRVKLGAGGMGEVYRADDTRLKRAVALKRIAPHLRSDAGYRQRFLREAQYASGLSSQHIAGIYDVLEENGEIFLVMEYVDGTTLRHRLSQPISIKQVLDAAAQCASALVTAHERGLVHRDIKPENIMLTSSGQVKILDFGVAKQQLRAQAETATLTLDPKSSFSGTLPYMAPEVLLEKEVDQRADIFSLGVVLYEALSGRHPFRADGFLATTDRVLHEVPAPLRQFNPKVSPELDRIVAKMLAKDPAERYATAADLLVDLRAVDRTATFPPAQLPSASRPQLVWAKRWALVGAIALIALGGTLAVPQVRQRLSSLFGAKPSGTTTLVVLPFQAIGGGEEQQVYSDGLTVTLTAKLTRLTATHNLQVVPAREVRTKNVSTAQEARRELGASLVLEGSIYRAGDQVRVNFEVVDTGTLHQLRAGTVTASAADPFAVQDRVSEGAVRLLALELRPEERRALEARGTQVAGAQEAYLQGLGYLQNYDKLENVESAIHAFDRALKLDPDYAQAAAGLGEAYWKKYEATKDPAWVSPSREACERAAKLEVGLAAAHICLGTLLNGTGHSDQAVGEFQRALDAEPTSDDAYRGLAIAYEHQGKFLEAEQTYRRAIELRPSYWAGYNSLGAFYYHRVRYAEAERMFQQVVTLAPDSIRGHYNLCAIYILQGRYGDAISACQRSVAIKPTPDAYSNLATTYFYRRKYEDALPPYEAAVKLRERDPVLWMNLGDAYYWAPGRHSDAPAAYRKAIELAGAQVQVNPNDAGALAVAAVCYAMVGERKRATDYLAAALKIAPVNPDVHFKAALIHNHFGETQRALSWLEKARAAGFSFPFMWDTPNFDNLRANPRFQNLLRGK